MDKWLDSLSEDWNSEPRSSNSNSKIDTAQSPVTSSPQSNLSQSRIPRYKPRSSSSDLAAPTQKSFDQLRRRETLALKERSSSDLNAAQTPGFKQALQSSSPSVPRPSRNRVGSASSLPHVPQDTVQHKPSRSSPAKDLNLQNTPDWKRRIIQGKVAPGEQCDLFSPIGLEKVFRPPNSGPRVKHGRDFKAKRNQQEEFPSSPPLYPSSSKKKSGITCQVREQSSGPVSPMQRNSKRLEDEADHRGSSGAVKNHRKITEHDRKKKSRMSNSSSGIKPRPKPVSARSSMIGSVERKEKSSSGTPSFQSRKSEADSHNASSKKSPDSSLQQDYRDENISPFYISRHQTLDGRVDYAALDMSVNQLRCQIDKLQLQQLGKRSPCSSDYGVDYTEAKSHGGSPLPEREIDWTAHSLPEDLSMGTDAFVAHGGFVNMRRGGYSNDGSFRRRPLSPSSLPAFENSESRSNAPNSGHPRRSREIAAIYPGSEPEPTVSTPTTPGKHQTKDQSSPARTQSSGSPLKLFDKYDTFTNDRVSRRINKFEENMRENPFQDDFEAEHENIDSPSRRSRHSKIRGQQNPGPAQNSERSQRRVSNFGDGELDNHSFSSSQPSRYGVGFAQEDRLILRRNSESDSGASCRNGDSLSKFPNLTPEGDEELDNLSSSHPSTKAITYYPHDSTSIVNKEHSFTSKDQDLDKGDVHNAQGKRLPHSPIKNSQTKRRRTLKSSAEPDYRPQLSSMPSEVKISATNSVVGRKRKDALYHIQNQVADPETLAMRTILRPRTYTAGNNEGPYREVNRDNLEEVNGPNSEFEKLAQDPPAQALVKQEARGALAAVGNIKGSRKASVSTADFFNEAQQIMRFIRAQGHPPQGSQVTPRGPEVYENVSLEHSVTVESPEDQFSRPPSRAGATLRRLREPVQLDARVVSHLRKFEEKGDLEIAFSSSFRSLRLEQAEVGFVDDKVERNDLAEEVVESDPPNLRIYRQLASQDSRRRSPTKNPQSFNAHTNAGSLDSSAPTSGPSTGRSLPTGSSRGSNSKAVIAPKTVSHLLSDEIAGMKYDQEKQVWIKTPVNDNSKTPFQSSGNSTEDVLGDIPDLSIDEVEEMQRIQDHAGSCKRTDSRTSALDHAMRKDKTLSQTGNEARPRTAEGVISTSEEDGSAQSKYSRFASSGPVPETRATSWGRDVQPGEEEISRNQDEGQDQESLVAENNEEYEEEVEHEISILEGRTSKTPTRPIRREHHARVVTVTFSSPSVGQLQTPYDDPGIEEEGSDLDLDDSPIKFDPQPEVFSARQRSSFDRKTSRRSSSRRISLGSQSYIARPMSRLDEEDEIAFLQASNGRRNPANDVIIATPLSRPRGMLAPRALSSSRSSSIGFHLSPLSDFTIHQVDQSSSRGHGDVVGRHGFLAENETGKFALVTQDLVKKLTDLEPYEPHWDLIRSMKLQNQGLATLHELDEFCGRLEELDVSNNSLDQLHGAPSSIRDLRICRNQLSDLSTWGHLYNLQYLDVSRNRIQSFRAFQRLVHLRELKADENEIESLDGLFQLDGLLSLRLRGNLVREIDFQGSNLKRLKTLDVYGNKLVKVAHLHHLPAIQHVNFGENELPEMDCSLHLFKTLETLNLSSNFLKSFDVSRTPNLRRLYLDKNAIRSIRGLTTLKRLETLSWREQSLTRTTGSDLVPRESEIQYHDCYNIQHLRLSANSLTSFFTPLPSFSPSPLSSSSSSFTFLNLQTLELASAGLQTLSPRFGSQFPNLRVLNLNYNALRDLRPLVGIVRLQTLLVVGNRVSRLRQTAAVLRRICGGGGGGSGSRGDGLEEVDLRQNPLTVGFYTPQPEEGQPGKQIALHTPTAIATATATASTSRSLQQQQEEETPQDDSQNNTTTYTSTTSSSSSSSSSYLLPPLNPTTDAQSYARLDKDTQLRRRVYEMMIAEGCPGLQRLDGLVVAVKEEEGGREGIKRQITGRKDGDGVVDGVRERLGELGVMRLGRGFALGGGK